MQFPTKIAEEDHPAGREVRCLAGAEQVRRAFRSACQPTQIDSQQPDNLAEGNRCDGKIVSPKPQCHKSNDGGKEDRGGNRCERCDPQGLIGFDDEDRHCIGADAHEGDMSEIGEAANAELQLQAQCEDRIDAGDYPDESPELDIEEGFHRQPTSLTFARAAPAAAAAAS